ncbi:MAG: helix-turn-helix transcriptional regulator [Desulfobacterales bacterium]|nr:MAG: helix-turn-helix transcriptional regulator [Desulfobacterales bacterium]
MKETSKQRRAQEALQQREAELEFRTSQLEEAVIALGVLLRQREDDKRELEERVLLNVNQLILPYVEKLKMSRVGDKQVAYLRILESNLQDIVSPFAYRLSSRYQSLTPAEIQIGHLIKMGKTTKEIADLLNLSHRTIETHRRKIRTKLGIKNRKTSLRTHLFSI